MPRIKIDPLALQTFQRLFGLTSLLELVDKAIPETEWHEREDLRQLAESEDWEFGDYDVETQVLDEKFRHWLPRFAAYSVVILLDSIVETQLLSFAERVGRNKNSKFQVKDIKGSGLERAALYLKRIAPELDVDRDSAWEDVQNLRELRNVIVHRGGMRGHSPEHQKQVDRLLRAYPGGVSLPWSPDSVYGEIWISVAQCREFATKIAEFFKRVFKAAGLPEKGIQIER